MTTTTFLQAVDGGLDLVAIAAGGVTSHTVADAAALVQPDLKIETAADFIGHSMGVPGLGAYYHVIFRYWLMQHGVDPAKVRFIEVSFPTMVDAMRGKSVDGVVTLDPSQSQILAAKVGKIAVPIYAEIPDDKPIVMYIATRAWAAGHKREVSAFRAAIAEAQDVTMADPERAKQALAKHAPMPPAVLAHVSIGAQSKVITKEGLRWWVEVMNAQQMLATKIDVDRLVME
jgi:NitT/TauT family transport system substrate-binding protein